MGDIIHRYHMVMSLVDRVDRDTKDWVIDASDEKAAAAGMAMDLEAAADAIDWIQNHCRLYEGERAGELIELMGYQTSFLTRLYGWQRWSRQHGRWVRRFKRGGLWAAKKNGKSPFLAAMELYTLIGCKERGQKVYTAAKDGDQARIAQMHAYKMVEYSPELSEDCKVYANTLEIVHLPTDSRMRILTGASERNKQAKEGLNGSVFIDECHVVDRALYKRISRAGISRAEPLDVAVSTAGDDVTGYGKGRFDYGRQVAAGDRDDLEYLHVEYTAPDGITEKEFSRDPAKYGRMANPAWGTIVDPDEFMGDFGRSRSDPREFALFLQYRANLWIGAAERWLDSFGWDAGEREYTLGDLADRECYGALDLSRTSDLTAFAVVFPWPEDGPEAVRVWPMFWLPEERARRLDHLFPFRSWARDGFVRLTPGEVVDYAVVKRDIRAACRGVRMLRLFFDPKYAEDITRQLIEGEVHPETKETVAEGLGGERVSFEQSPNWFHAPSEELERRVKIGAVQHPGNRVLTWQVGHAVVRRTADDRIKPVKPVRYGPQTVDGVVCLAMGTFGVMHHRPAVYVY